MKIKNLASTPVEKVIQCFLQAFEGYFVKLPEDVEYWKARFVTARVDWELSFGMFQEDRLVGFIINCIDNHNGFRTAYNTGTGVLPEFRGKGIVDQLYAHALPMLKKKGVEKCLLEVICENGRAIKVYERIGFRITRELKTFQGQLPEGQQENDLQKCLFSEVMTTNLYHPEHYSWDNSAGAIKILGDQVEVYCLGGNSDLEAFFALDTSGNILQLESKSGNYSGLLVTVASKAQEVKLKNVDSKRTILIDVLQKLHFKNPVNQYEMEMKL